MSSRVTAARNARVSAFGQLREMPVYPFVILALYMIPVIYMQGSRIRMRFAALVSGSEMIGYFHAELVFLVLAACALSAFRAARRWAFVPFAGLYMVTVLDWLSWTIQGRTFYFTDIYRAIQLLVYYPEFVTETPFLVRLKAVVLLAFPVVVWVAVRRGAAVAVRSAGWLTVAAGVACGLFFLVTPFLASRGYVYNNTFASMVDEIIYDAKFRRQDPGIEELRPQLGSATGLSIEDRHMARPPNILIFVIETASYPFYPATEALLGELNIPDVAHNAITFSRHYSTYPGSDRATLSLLTGRYPPIIKGSKWKEESSFDNNLVGILRENGYRTYLMSTAPLSFYGDQHMYQRVGFESMRVVERAHALRRQVGKSVVWDRAGLYEADLGLVDMSIDAVDSHFNESADSPFFMVVAPQSSHAPFQCPPVANSIAQGDCSTEVGKVSANAFWQFRLLGNLLERIGKIVPMDDVLIVITGDHGVRSVHETKLFSNPAMLQEAAFHVPLIISTPLLVGVRKVFGYPTSHVDLAPTLLRMAGIEVIPDMFHGRDLFSETERNVYFLGGDYSPVNGFVRDGTYYMENRGSRLYGVSKDMDFASPGAMVVSRSTEGWIEDQIMRLKAHLHDLYFAPKMDMRRE